MTDALRVALEGDSRHLLAELDRSSKATLQFTQKAETSVEKLNRRFTTLRNVVVGVFSVRAIRGVTNWISETAKAQDEVGKFADRVGFSVEGLSRLEYAAELSGVSVDSLRQGLQRATRRLAEFASTGRGEAATAIKELGLEEVVRQGQTFEELLPRISTAFASLGDQGQRVRLSQKLFDSEGVSFIQLLQQGPEAIRALSAEADRLGITLSKADTDRAAALVDASTRLERAFEGISNAILRFAGSGLAEVLENAAQLVSAAGGGGIKGSIQLDPLIAREIELEKALRKNLEQDVALLNAEDAPGGRYRTRFGLSTVTRADAQARISREMEAIQRELDQVRSDLDFRRDQRLGVFSAGPQIDPDELARRQLGPGAEIIRDLFGQPSRSSTGAPSAAPVEPGFLDGLRAGTDRVAEFENAARNAENAVVGLGFGLAGDVATALDGFIDGSARGTEAFAQFGRSVAGTIQQMITQFIALQAVGGLFRAVGGGAAGAATEFQPLAETSTFVDPATLPSPIFKGGGGAVAGVAQIVVNVSVQQGGDLGDVVQEGIAKAIPQIATAVRAYERRSPALRKVPA